MPNFQFQISNEIIMLKFKILTFGFGHLFEIWNLSFEILIMLYFLSNGYFIAK